MKWHSISSFFDPSRTSTPLPKIWESTVLVCSLFQYYGLKLSSQWQSLAHFASFIYLCLKSQELVYFIAWYLVTWRLLFHVYCPIEKNMFQVGGQIETLYFCQKVKVESEVKNIWNVSSNLFWNELLKH